MKRLAFAALLATVAAPALAGPSLEEVLDGAISVVSPAGGFLIVVKAEGAFICALNLNPSYFAALAASQAPADETRPAAICVSASDVQTLGN